MHKRPLSYLEIARLKRPGRLIERDTHLKVVVSRSYYDLCYSCLPRCIHSGTNAICSSPAGVRPSCTSPAVVPSQSVTLPRDAKNVLHHRAQICYRCGDDKGWQQSVSQSAFMWVWAIGYDSNLSRSSSQQHRRLNARCCFLCRSSCILLSIFSALRQLQFVRRRRYAERAHARRHTCLHTHTNAHPQTARARARTHFKELPFRLAVSHLGARAVCPVVRGVRAFLLLPSLTCTQLASWKVSRLVKVLMWYLEVDNVFYRWLSVIYYYSYYYYYCCCCCCFMSCYDVSVADLFTPRQISTKPASGSDLLRSSLSPPPAAAASLFRIPTPRGVGTLACTRYWSLCFYLFLLYFIYFLFIYCVFM